MAAVRKDTPDEHVHNGRELTGMNLSVDIKKSYDDFGLRVKFDSDSKRIGILGASGSGKSMTLKAISGLITPDEGRISVGKSILYDSREKVNVKTADRNVGYLFQSYALFPNMTVRENLESALHGARRRERRAVSGRTQEGSINGQAAGTGNNIAGKQGDRRLVNTYIKKFGLEEVADHRPGELSGGQQQRTALARMLICDPGLLLLDEPFSAVDTFMKEGMRLELIRILNEYNKQVILVSHDRDEIYQMCNYLVLMDKGRVIAHGKTDELFRHPGTEVAARLTGCKNISRIEKLTEHRIKALDWGGLELVTGEKVTDDITHAGIRAHDFIPGEHGVNVIACGQAMISKMPFEWYVTLENGLWWKLGRNLDEEYKSSVVPQYISVEPDRIVLLKAGQKTV